MYHLLQVVLLPVMPMVLGSITRLSPKGKLTATGADNCAPWETPVDGILGL